MGEPEHEIRSVVFYPDGSTIAVSDRRKTKIADAQSGATRITIPSGSHFPFALNPIRNILAKGPDEFYDSLGGQEIRSPVTGNGTSVAFSPDGTAVFDGVNLWNLDTRKRVARLTFTGTMSGSVFTPFSHNGKMIAMEYGLWNTSGGRPLWMQSRDDSRYVTGVAFTPDDRFVLTSDRNGQVRIAEVATGRIANTIHPHEQVEGLALSPDGSLLVTIGPRAMAR